MHKRDTRRKRQGETHIHYTLRKDEGQLGLSRRLIDRRCLQVQALVPEDAPDVLLEHWGTGRDGMS